MHLAFTSGLPKFSPNKKGTAHRSWNNLPPFGIGAVECLFASYLDCAEDAPWTSSSTYMAGNGTGWCYLGDYGGRGRWPLPGSSWAASTPWRHTSPPVPRKCPSSTYQLGLRLHLPLQHITTARRPSSLPPCLTTSSHSGPQWVDRGARDLGSHHGTSNLMGDDEVDCIAPPAAAQIRKERGERADVIAGIIGGIRKANRFFSLADGTVGKFYPTSGTV